MAGGSPAKGAQLAVVNTSASSQSGELTIPACYEDRATGVVPFYLYVVAPVLANGWVFLGEGGDKFVTASPERFSAFTALPHSIAVRVAGVAGELVPVLFGEPASQPNAVTVMAVMCDFQGSTNATLTAACSWTSTASPPACTCG